MNCLRCESEIDHIAEKAIAEAVVRASAEVDKWFLAEYGCDHPDGFIRQTAEYVAAAIRAGFDAYHQGGGDRRASEPSRGRLDLAAPVAIGTEGGDA